MNLAPKVIFILHQVGPYHHARFRALAAKVKLVVLEIRPDSKEYDWFTGHEDLNYERIGFTKSNSSSSDRKEAIYQLLGQLNPDAIIVTGWSEAEYLYALTWGKGQKKNVVGISDSTFHDEPRPFFKEWIKGFIVRSYDAFIVAGKASRNYLLRFKFPETNIFQPWDVVDNDYFVQESSDDDLVDVVKRKYNLPENYFLCVARYIEKKNHINLLNAYKRYVEHTNDANSLVLIGSGPLKEKIQHFSRENQLDSKIVLLDFIQYDELPAFYSLAKVLVLASKSDQWGLVVNEALACGIPAFVSRNCGCSEDLIKEGKNGYLFNPSDVHELSNLMMQNLSFSDDEIKKTNQKLLTNFSIGAFVNAVSQSLDNELQRPLNYFSKRLIKMIYR